MDKVHVQITGVQDEDDFVKVEIGNSADTFAQKIGNLFRRCKSCEISLDINVKKHKNSGDNKRVKYSVHTKLQTPFGLLNAESHDFGRLISVVQSSLSKLEKEAKKKHDKAVNK